MLNILLDSHTFEDEARQQSTPTKHVCMGCGSYEGVGNYFQVVRSNVWAPGRALLLPGAVVTSSCNLGTMIQLRIARGSLGQ
jgi:hypothetical protein